MQVDTKTFCECNMCGILFNFNKHEEKKIDDITTELTFNCPCCKVIETKIEYYFNSKSEKDLYLQIFNIIKIVVD